MARIANAEELALIAQEIGTEVIKGLVRCPSAAGDGPVAEIDRSKFTE